MPLNYTIDQLIKAHDPKRALQNYKKLETAAPV